MGAGAQLSVTDKRRATRYPVDHKLIAEHRQLGDIHLRIVNISAQGFMALGDMPLGRGERLTIRLPVIGRIEAHLIWSHDERSGFQFERIIRLDDFMKLIDALQPNPRLRLKRPDIRSR
ncbi:MAG: PilZ domain-containing protein [Novosphingobium sp.]|nr:PilZ domain-containing protein [Novosphingobium sp.]